MSNYSEEVLQHYQNPQNIGSFPDADTNPNIGVGIVGAPECGDVLQLHIYIENKDGKYFIKDAKFKTFGCGSAIASSSFATSWMKGMSLEEAESVISDKKIANELKLKPVKIHCSVLAREAITVAIKDFKEKQSNNSASTAV